MSKSVAHRKLVEAALALVITRNPRAKHYEDISICFAEVLALTYEAPLSLRLTSPDVTAQVLAAPGEHTTFEWNPGLQST